MKSHGVGLMMIGLVVLGTLILLAALIQLRMLPWLTSVGVGAAITTVSFLIEIRSFVGLHVEKYGLPLGWLVIVFFPPRFGNSEIYGVVIQAYLIDLIIWSLGVKVLIYRLLSEQGWKR